MKHGKAPPTRKSIYKHTSCLLKLAAFVLIIIIQADDQMMRLWSVFVHCFSLVDRNTQGRQAGN